MSPRYRCAPAAPASAFVPPPLESDRIRGGASSIVVFDNDEQWRPTGILDPHTLTERLVYVGPEPIGFLTFLGDRE